MKIVCPSCAATYEVPEAVLAARRPVRCARCGNNWVPGGEEEALAEHAAEPAPQPLAPQPPADLLAVDVPRPDAAIAAPGIIETPPEPVVAAMPEPAPPPPVVAPAAPVMAARAADPAEMLGDKPPLTGWIVTIAVLVSLAAASLVFREPIMKAWPASRRAYASLGLYLPH